jgi:hypothetical protein
MFQPENIKENDDFLTRLKVFFGMSNPSMRKGVVYYIYTGGRSIPGNQVYHATDRDLYLGLSYHLFSCLV